jgi:hypothetical protein
MNKYTLFLINEITMNLLNGELVRIYIDSGNGGYEQHYRLIDGVLCQTTKTGVKLQHSGMPHDIDGYSVIKGWR